MGKLWIILIFVLIDSIACYPDGAPEKACYIMIPRHTRPVTNVPVMAQKAVPPYNITISRSVFNPDVPVRVTIQGIRGAPFKGFFLIAGEEGSKDWPVGVFRSYTNKARSMYCSYKNDAATHADGKWKDSITLDWYAPMHTAADHIQFIATVVTNRTTYWTDIRSALMTQDPNMQEPGELGEGGGIMTGLGGGRGAGVDAWGYPTTASYDTNTWGRGGSGGSGGEGGRGGSSGGFGGFRNIWASLLGGSGNNAWGRGFNNRRFDTTTSGSWGRNTGSTTPATTWRNRDSSRGRWGSAGSRNNAGNGEGGSGTRSGNAGEGSNNSKNGNQPGPSNSPPLGNSQREGNNGGGNRDTGRNIWGNNDSGRGGRGGSGDSGRGGNLWGGAGGGDSGRGGNAWGGDSGGGTGQWGGNTGDWGSSRTRDRNWSGRRNFNPFSMLWN